MPDQVPRIRVVADRGLVGVKVDSKVAHDAPGDRRVIAIDPRIDDRNGDTAAVRVAEDLLAIE